jgi:hypothetical protein
MQPYHGNMSIKIPYMRKGTSSTLIALFTAITLLLLASPLSLSNPILQPAQAQTSMTFKTPKPATYTDPDTGQEATLTFDAQGITTPSGPASAKITSGTIQVDLPDPDASGPTQTLTGNITSGAYITSRSPTGIQFYATIQNTDFLIESACTTSGDNPIEVNPGGSSGGIFNGGIFSGAVECSPSQGGGDTTAQPSSPSPSSSSLTGSSEGTDRGSSSNSSASSNNTDRDSDGIPDSSDNCPNNSDHRCFKEGDTGTTTSTTDQQQPSSSSSSNGAGNQTR